MSDARSPVQGAELWVPQGEQLVLRAGAYGPHTEFARVSARTRFPRGEGLPGAVWETERALIWSDLGTHFVRAEYAAAAGIDAALGIPWFQGRELAAVVTLLLTRQVPSPACLELWNHDVSVHVLRHGGGLYAHAAEFGRVSALVQFPYAAGLPGLTWSTGIPVTVDDVRTSNEFVRAELAMRAGLKRAVGIPIYRERKVAHVLTLLGAESGSFLRAFDLFAQSEAGLTRKLGFEADAPQSVGASASSASSERERAAREARYARLPLILSSASLPGASHDEGRSSILLALPVHDGVRVRAVAALEF